MKSALKFLLVVSSIFLTFGGCTKDGALNVFSVSDDIKFGQQLDEEIRKNPSEYPILDKAKYPQVYAYAENVFNTILSKGDFNYRSEFPWTITIINADVKNAFAAPGGYLYFYTGLMKYSTSEAEFAGVMAHEMAHADKRHATNVMTKQYGFTVLADILLGKNAGTLTQIAKEMALGSSNLKFTRDHEYEADEYSVRYLAATQKYMPTAINNFFDRLVADGSAEGKGNMEFLRTHPYEDNRKANVIKVWENLGSPTGGLYESEYQAFLKLLP